MKTATTDSQPDQIPLQNAALSLLSECVEETGKPQKEVASDLGLAPNKFNDLLKGRRPITPEIAARLGDYFGNSAEYWLRLQLKAQMRQAERDLGIRILRDIPVVGSAK